MKVSALVATVLKPFLATDAKPEDVVKAVIAADKKARDEAASGEIEKKDQPKMGDKKAKDMAMKAKDKKAKDENKDADEKEDEDMAGDRDDDPENTNGMSGMDSDEEYDLAGKDEDLMDQGDPSTPGGSRNKGKTTQDMKKGMDRKGMDSATVNKIVQDAIAQRDALHAARREVEPVLGIVAFDSATEVYKAALTKLGIDTAGVHASAFPALLKLAKDKATTQSSHLAVDSADSAAMAKLIPGYGRLR